MSWKPEFASFRPHIRGDSMYPAYGNGGIIAVQVLDGVRGIQWGKPHPVSPRHGGPPVRRIRDSDGEITAVSGNPTYRPVRISNDGIAGLAIDRGLVGSGNR